MHGQQAAIYAWLKSHHLHIKQAECCPRCVTHNSPRCSRGSQVATLLAHYSPYGFPLPMCCVEERLWCSRKGCDESSCIKNVLALAASGIHIASHGRKQLQHGFAAYRRSARRKLWFRQLSHNQLLTLLISGWAVSRMEFSIFALLKCVHGVARAS